MLVTWINFAWIFLFFIFQSCHPNLPESTKCHFWTDQLAALIGFNAFLACWSNCTVTVLHLTGSLLIVKLWSLHFILCQPGLIFDNIPSRNWRGQLCVSLNVLKCARLLFAKCYHSQASLPPRCPVLVAACMQEVSSKYRESTRTGLDVKSQTRFEYDITSNLPLPITFTPLFCHAMPDTMLIPWYVLFLNHFIGFIHTHKTICGTITVCAPFVNHPYSTISIDPQRRYVVQSCIKSRSYSHARNEKKNNLLAKILCADTLFGF